jgi:hypothetical protein
MTTDIIVAIVTTEKRTCEMVPEILFEAADTLRKESVVARAEYKNQDRSWSCFQYVRFVNMRVLKWLCS